MLNCVHRLNLPASSFHTIGDTKIDTTFGSPRCCLIVLWPHQPAPPTQTRGDTTLGSSSNNTKTKPENLEVVGVNVVHRLLMAQLVVACRTNSCFPAIIGNDFHKSSAISLCNNCGEKLSHFCTLNIQISSHSSSQIVLHFK